MSEIKLPEGWVWRTLLNLGQWSGGGTPSKANPEFWQGGNVAWVSPKDMKSMYIQDTEDKITSEAVINSSAKYIDPPALLFVVRSGILRRTLPVALTYNRLTVNQDIKTLSLSGQVHPEYVYYYLQCENRQILTNCSKAGTTVESIEIGLLKQVAIPLPSLPIQQAIVAKIEELFSELDAGVKELQTALARLKTYRQAVLHHYLNNPDWERVRLGEVVEKIQIGPFGTQLHQEDYMSNGIPLINPTHIKKGKIITDNELTVSKEKYAELSNYYLRSGDTIMGRRGEMARCALVTEKESGWLCGTGSLYIRPNTSTTNPKFLSQILGNSSTKTFLENEASGSTMSNLNLKILKSGPLSMPDLVTQDLIVSEVEAQLSEADAMEAIIRQELVRCENLRQSILKQAFEGKLVMNPIDELELAETSEQDQTIYKSKNVGLAGEQLSLF